MFRLGVKNPLANVSKYVETLKKTDISKIDHNITKYGNVLFTNNNKKWDKEVINSNELRTLLSSLMVYPEDYHKHGNFKNWYNFGNYIRTHNFYNDGLLHKFHHLDHCWQKHRETVLKVQKNNDLQFNQKEIEDYETFMTILQQWDNVPKQDIVLSNVDPFLAMSYASEYIFYMFNKTNYKTDSIEELNNIFGKFHVIPNLRTLLMWQSHMLDHRQYEKDCKKINGKIIDNAFYNKTKYEIEMGKFDTEFLMNKENKVYEYDLD